MSSVSDKGVPTYYRSLGELAGDPEFEKRLDHEFLEPAELGPVSPPAGQRPQTGPVGQPAPAAPAKPADPPAADAQTPAAPDRRRFLKVAGASVAAAGAASACRWKEDKILPYTKRPEGVAEGVPRWFATAMDIGGFATGLRVKSYDGRPIKVEGNPEHPDSRGAAGVFHQASVLELYDPDRSKKVATYSGGKRTESDWTEFKKFHKALFSSLRNQPAGLRVLSEASSSPSLAEMQRRLVAAFPAAKWYEYEPVSDDNVRAGSQLAFGGLYRPLPALERAAVILSLDSDFLGSERLALRVAPGFIEGRLPEKGRLNRLYVIESAFTMTGGVADHRLPLRSELVKAIAVALDASISAKAGAPAQLGPAQANPNAAFLSDPKVSKFLAAVEKELLNNRGRSVILAGEHQPPEVHALVHRLNALLGNVGQTMSYVPDPLGPRLPHVEGLRQLVQEMNAGQVDTLVILGGNPVFNAPADLAFATALGKVKNSIRLGLHEDETSQKCAWHVPQSHYLEAWGDARGYDGTVSIVQPLIAPLYESKSAIELVAMLLGDSTSEGIDIVKRTLSRRLSSERPGDERLWRKAVHDGIVAGTGLTPLQPPMRPLAPVQLSAREQGALEVQNGQLELVLFADGKVYDGRYAHNGWLQELPDMMTKMTWDNAAIMSPKTAKQLGVETGDLVTLSAGGNSVTLPALASPGQAAGSVRVALGYGRTASGILGIGSYLEHTFTWQLAAELAEGKVEPVGVNTYALRTTQLVNFAGGLSVQATGKKKKLAITEETHAIKDEIGKKGIADRLGQLVREATFEQYKQHPDFAQHAVHHPPLLSLWREPVNYDGHRWGMSIDMNRCIGCNACMVACQSENNISVVGRARVLQGREMHWLRIDRYYKGDPESPELVHQPLPCMQCENAPCEQVCPVGATMHSHEGLNDMVYNRCIGTRYCSNNCPYKVRRFNYFNMNEELKQEKNLVKTMVFNPDVTVRFRGVMEKCTYCVQRIQDVKIRAKNDRRPIKDGEIVPACAQTCPTQAIVFGDLNDKQSEVARLQNLPRNYSLLEELNVRPRTQYLARVRNPNPELA